jgi:hypothetical protein
MMGFFKRRLNERSTWATLIPAVMLLVGVKVSPEHLDTLGQAAGVLLAVFAAVPDGSMTAPKE